MKGLLLDSDYLENRDPPAMRLFLKKDGETITAIDPHFSHYFYVSTDDPEKLSKAVSNVEAERSGERVTPKSVEVVEKKLLGEEKKVIKVVTKNPQDITPLRKAISDLPNVDGFYEHDIPRARRYLIDNELTPMNGVKIEGESKESNDGKRIILTKPPESIGEIEEELNVLSFDIETYNPAGTPQSEKDPIIMISAADNQGLEKVLVWKDFDSDEDYVEVLDSEKKMIERFVQLIQDRDVDILMGYNTDLFDFPYLTERAEKLGVKLELGRDDSEPSSKRRRFSTVTQITGRAHIDVYAMVEFLSRIGAIRLIDYTLESVYEHVTGEEKPDIDYSAIPEAWEDGGKKAQGLLEYSLSDASAALELGDEFLPLFTELSRTVKQSLFDVSRMTPGQLVEWLLIFNSHKINELVPPRPVGKEYRRRRGESYIGGYVKEPTEGLHEDLVVFDFQSLYPTIIVTHNIDPATLNCDCCSQEEAVTAPNFDYQFCQNKKGFIPETLRGLIESRSELKKEMNQYEDGTREYQSIYNRQWALKIIANSFYGMLGYPRARWYSKECAESVTSFGRQYIKDTIEMAKEEGFEVIYGDTDSLFCKLDDKNREDVNDFLNKINESLPGLMELEFEDYYKRGIFVTKKRYAMISEDNKLVVKGLEFVRRDWAAVAKRTQEQVLEAILHDASPKKAAEIVHETTKSIKKGEVDLEDLIIHTQLKKSLEEYKSRGPHVAAAERLKEAGEEVEPGMTITYIVERGSGSISDRSIPTSQFDDCDYDPDYYIENQVLPAVMRIMEVLDYDEEDLRYEKTKQMKLGKFG
ncbi:MAG: DNA polymerase [Hadesarchaea archaeon]|nr:DNA polymerase [Hadesarchaea archaeon]